MHEVAKRLRLSEWLEVPASECLEQRDRLVLDRGVPVLVHGSSGFCQCGFQFEVLRILSTVRGFDGTRDSVAPQQVEVMPLRLTRTLRDEAKQQLDVARRHVADPIEVLLDSNVRSGGPEYLLPHAARECSALDPCAEVVLPDVVMTTLLHQVGPYA